MRSFRVIALEIQAINSSMDAISAELDKLSRATGTTSTGASAAQLASLQTQLDSLRAQVAAGFGTAPAHALNHAAAGSDPVQISESQVTNLVTDLAGKEAANANIQAHIASTSNPHSVTKAQVGLGNVDNTADASKTFAESQITGLVADLAGKAASSHAHAESDITGLVADLAAKEAAANKGAVNGYAPLDTSAKVPVSNLPTGLAPGVHASTHASGGSDPVPGMSGIFDDVVAAAAVTVTVAAGQQMIRIRRAVVRGRLINRGRVRVG